ncbi:MAG TPA: hypothetical protein DCM71_06330 [Runella sp.]|nr:hypothetical protein [Runella sp.]
MKQFHFILQAKGGVGKSFLVYLLALKHQSQPGTYFVDVDASTQTSSRQLAFLSGTGRIAALSMLDERQKITRDKLLFSLTDLSQLPFENCYLDFGAPESEQIPALFSVDFSTEQLYELAQHLQCQFIFDVVIAGNTSYFACTQYLQQMQQIIGNTFPICIWVNQYSFYKHPQLISEIQSYATQHQLQVNFFGDIDTSTQVGNQILKMVQLGHGLERYDFITSMKLKNELAKL